MPNDRIQPETDGDPRTVLEDTKNHERVGFELTEDEFTQDQGEDVHSQARSRENRD